jgi:hypothetical protein
MTTTKHPSPAARPRLHPRAARALAALATLAVLAVLAAPSLSVARVAPARAHGARTVSLHATGNLRLLSKQGFTLNERGTSTGTVSGTIYVHLKLVSTSRVTAEVNMYPHGGSISGYASANYRREGALGTFSGTMNIARGTGSYANARGSGLSFSGTIQRSNDAITVRVSGTVSD